MTKEIESLENFIEDPDLERLKELTNEFNIFASLNIIDTEIRHSIFLSWLLSPNENHDLNDYFLKLFIKKASSESGWLKENKLSLVDIDVWNWDNAIVLREWKGIDILIINDDYKFLCAIENKIYSREHGNQLQRYLKALDESYPHYKKLLLYLTITGETPSEESFNIFTYADILKLIDRLFESRKSTLNEEIRIFISHYEKMLRRYIMENSEINRLCKKIYSKHRKALDLIFEQRPDTQSERKDSILEILQDDEDILVDYATKSEIAFIPKEWDSIIEKRGDMEWSSEERILLFVFDNAKDTLRLRLVIFPGDPKYRERIHKIANESNVRGLYKRRFTSKWATIWIKQFLKKGSEELETEYVEEKIRKIWGNFKERDLPEITEKIIEKI